MSSALAIPEIAVRPPLPVRFLTAEWREWAERVFQEDSYGELWGPPDAANLHPAVPW